MREKRSTAHGRHHRQSSQNTWQIPIVDRHRRIIGWTSEDPQLMADPLRVRHVQAEELVGGPVVCTYVQISDPAAARRAGAPPEWQQPWRCIALVSEKAATQRSDESLEVTTE